MSKYLLIGDMHVKNDSIDECRALMEWVADECVRHSATPVMMGDQTDTHGNVRVEVLHFWAWVYMSLLPKKGIRRSVTLVGNHDMNFACSHTSLVAFRDSTHLIGQACELIDQSLGLYGVGYIKGGDKFVDEVSRLPTNAKILLCHQEFDGARYESGFYAPAGAKLDKVPGTLMFVSGHIHLQQTIGDRVVYVGTPRQVGRADSDPDKSVWLLDHSGLTPIRVPDTVVPRFVRVALHEGDRFPHIEVPGKTFVDVYGSVEFIKKAVKQLPDGVRIRTFPDRQSVVRREFKESDGVGVALVKYVDSYVADHNVPAGVKDKLVEKLKILCPGLV